MNIKTTLSISEARKKIFKIAEDVQKPSSYYTLTENGRAKAVIISVDEFDSWKETLEAMHDFPDLKKDIKETNSAIKSGEYKNWTSLDDLLAKEGYSTSGNKNVKHHASNKNKAKGGKRTKKSA